MRRRVVLACATSLLLTLGLSAGLVSAGGGTLIIGDGPGGTDAEGHQTFGAVLTWNGTAWPEPAGSDFSGAICGDVEWINFVVPDDLGVELRMVSEFPLAGLPAGATITDASLALRDVSFTAGNEFLAGGFAGNGVVEAADAAAAGTPLAFTPTTNDYEDWNVTSLMTPAAVSAGWIGFVLAPAFDRSDEDAPNNAHRFRCFDQGAFPILTIQYDLPPPATPAVTGLPDAALPDAGPISDLAILGFGLLLTSSLGVLAVASARTRIR